MNQRYILLIFLTTHMLMISMGRKEAEERYKAYHQFKSKNGITTEEVEKQFPQLFKDIPKSLHSKIVQYAKFLYGDQVIEKMAQENPEEITFFKWSAVGFIYNVLPYYHKNFFYFEQTDPNTTILQGIRDDFKLDEYLDAMNLWEEGKAKGQETRNMLVAIGEKITEECNEKSNFTHKKSNTELCNQLKIDKEKLEKKYQVHQVHEQKWYHDMKHIGHSLTQEYKIHLMPEGDVIPVLISLLNALTKDHDLQKLVAGFKILSPTAPLNKDEIPPRMIVYLTAGKTYAQKGLDKLYHALKDIKGSGIRPRFSAKVNDLIWIAQGDSQFKKDEYARYYEEPYRVYYHPTFMGNYVNYHLINPQTGKEITY